ncbi:MAG: AAA family ATPase [Blastocatellia bacterium]|nr:AAA family ATPase [Blastocatellia bacterium]
MPNVVVIAGPNGAGKSTLAPALLRDTLNIREFVNADTIAEGLSAFAPEDASFDAGRVMLGRLRDLAAEEKDFAFETTLASRFYAGWLKELQEHGYEVSLVFLWLESVDIAVQRVAARVRAGGHSVPEDTIRRRYERGLKNLFDLYIPVANSWRVFHGSPIIPKEIARFDEPRGEVIFDNDLWKQIKG